MANGAPTFDKLIDEVEALDGLLDDGPGDDSQEFLDDVQAKAKALYETSQALTADDVDREFTEDESEAIPA